MPYDADSHSALTALIEHAQKAGADAAEASVAQRESLSVDVRMGALEGVEREESRSIALRAFVGQRQASASSSDLSPSGLRALAERVTQMAKTAPEDKYCGLLDAPLLDKGPWPDLEQTDTARPEAEHLRDMALAAEAAALAVAGVANSSGAGASWDYARFAHRTSTGFEASETGTSYSLVTQPIAERDGAMERDYEYRTKRFFADLPSPEALGKAAGERTVARLGPRKIKSCKAPVIFENRLASGILGPLLSGITGAAVARGTSFVKDKLGQRVLPESFQIAEDPFLKRGLASRAFDGEGMACRERPLIENGVITTWLLNSASARQLGLEPTGHATHGHGGPPGVSTSNLAVKPGEHDLQGLMRSAGAGLFVTDKFSPSLNMNNGDWSIGVSGYWFENGEIAYPVSEITVAGNLLDIYARLIAGADLDRRGAIEIPSLLVDDLAIGGL